MIITNMLFYSFNLDIIDSILLILNSEYYCSCTYACDKAVGKMKIKVGWATNEPKYKYIIMLSCIHGILIYMGQNIL